MPDLSLGIDLLRRALGPPAKPEVADGAREAAVAAILTPGTAGPDLWFIIRAHHPKDPWSGHVAFPGGRIEASDADSRAAAMRETYEEIGVDLENADSLGPLDDLAPLGATPRLLVHPHVFWLSSMPKPVLNPTEVSGLLQVPLSGLLGGSGRGRFDLDWKGKSWVLPKVELPHMSGESARLWGMTLHIVDGLLHRIDGQGTGLERPLHSGVSAADALRT